MNYGDKVNGSDVAEGDVLKVQIPKNKVTIETTGPADIVLGLWGPFKSEDEADAIPPHGVLRVAGVGKWGTHNCAPGWYALKIVKASGQDFTFKLRKYNLLDERKLKFQK
jgi:hypothetical protein